MEYQPKSNEKYSLLLHCISQLLRVLLTKICRIQPPDLLFLVLYYILHQQTSFFTDFQDFIQHYLKKKILVTNFLFLTDSLKRIPPTPLTASQNPLRVTKVFVDTPLTVISIYWVGQCIYSSLLSVPIFLSSRLDAGPLLQFFMRKVAFLTKMC